MRKQFSRQIEDFICDHCGHQMKGNGYTNHCSKCLWSKHVDINPGDRAAACHGLMAPVGLEIKRRIYVIIHKCIVCTHIRKNKTVADDNMNRIMATSSGSYNYKNDPLFVVKQKNMD